MPNKKKKATAGPQKKPKPGLAIKKSIQSPKNKASPLPKKKPTAPTKPIKSKKPTKSVKPKKPAKSTRPTKPTKPTKSAKPTRSIKPTKPAKPKNTKVTKSTKAIKSKDISKLTKRAKPKEDAKTEKITKPTKSAKAKKIKVTKPKKSKKASKAMPPKKPTKPSIAKKHVELGKPQRVTKKIQPSTSSTIVKVQKNVGQSKNLSSAVIIELPMSHPKHTLGSSNFGKTPLIWSAEEWTRFRQLLKKLQRVSGIPGTPCNHILSSYHTEHEKSEAKNPARMLSLQDEQDLADGLAFLAATSKGPAAVSAVTIEEHSNPTGLKINIAANDGAALHVRTSFMKIASILENYARSKVHGSQNDIIKAMDECVSKVFDEIIGLSQTRIQQRLRPQRSGSISLLRHLDAIDKEPTRLPSLSFNEAENFKSELNDFRTSCYDALKLKTTDLSLLKAIVRKAYRLTNQDKSESPVRFQTYFAQELMEKRENATTALKKINLLGKYWRFSRSLVKAARKYSSLFENIEALSLPTKRQEIVDGHPYRVHCEVQLILHHESTPHEPPPRVIGSSKKACYLCNLFIQKHGQFFVSKTHGQLYDHWNITDTDGLQMKSIIRIREVLNEVSHDISETINQSPATRIRNPQVAESSAGSLRTGLSNISLSTIKSIRPVYVVPFTETLSCLQTSKSIDTRPNTSIISIPTPQNSAVASPGPSRFNLVTKANDTLTPRESPEGTGATNKPTSSAESTPRGPGTATRGIEDDQISIMSSMPSSIDLKASKNLPVPAPTMLQRGQPTEIEVCKDCTADLKAGSIRKFVTFESPSDNPVHNSSSLPGKSYQYGKAKMELITQEDAARDGLEVFRLEDLQSGEERAFPTSMLDGKDPALNLCISKGKDLLRVFCTWK